MDAELNGSLMRIDRPRPARGGGTGDGSLIQAGPAARHYPLI